MKISKLSPNFEVSDIRKTVLFYSENFGFKLVMAVPETQDGVDQILFEDKEYVYAMMQQGAAEIMIQRSDNFKTDVVFSEGMPIGASVSFYMEIEGIENLYQSLQNKNLEITELKKTWYGMHEFYLKDLNGYILSFAEKLE
ncbi:VOC family protein [Flavobacterium hungaricum]|uniref:Bleomycin resistance family protein n=1 Tax=Flavobacterium hungaricum TaxID=2082725 RepID=A0ABR9TQI2_9FLAO|nr:VOC family protein [Flavobacterium hungaricum]MBE8727618.1 bleomycin resistance family protein [Flavobacterium hungaricum]